MKTLTLKQPWATVIASGIKHYEFRSWKTSYRGPLLIHAGMGMDIQAEKHFQHLSFNYPKAEIMCLVELEDCIKVDEEFLKKLLKEKLALEDYLKACELMDELTDLAQLNGFKTKGEIVETMHKWGL